MSEKQDFERLVGPDLYWITVNFPLLWRDIQFRSLNRKNIVDVRELIAGAQRTLAEADSKLVDCLAGLPPEE